MTNQQTNGGLTVEDRAAIDDLFAHYAWALDCGDDDAFAEIFTDDATIEDPSGRYTAPDAPRKIMAAMRANTTFPGRQHWIAQTVLEGTGRECSARSFAMVTARHDSGATALHLLAAYFDRLVKIDQRWYVADRLIKPWRGELVEAFPEVREQPAWSQAQQKGPRR
ncbi:hypothetical protein GCM10023169_35240 [Georgenia halophila]|uniref:SnoaL-like domain-containing protein n=1 Tax=Georgenia halophila TaxID=620889 RepID=A0ABP8LLA1_9MICO